MGRWMASRVWRTLAVRKLRRRAASSGERLAGDLEAVDEETGAADVELIGSEADDDLAEGVLDGLLVGGGGEVEAATGATGVGVGDRLAVRVVVVAEVLAAERG
jgi:hypothetical protein